MRILNPFRLGLFGGLGVLVAIAIGAAFTSLSQVLTYVGAAIFIALGLEPIIGWLEQRRFPRWAAIVTVLVAFAGVITGLVFAIIPVIGDQVNRAINAIPDLVDRFMNGQVRQMIVDAFAWIPQKDVEAFLDSTIAWLEDLDYASIAGGALNVGLGIITGATGGIIVFILTLYFAASIQHIKRGLYRLVPASKRAVFTDLAEQISASVGRFVIGQATLGLANGVLSSVVLGVVFPYVFQLPITYWALFAFLALLGSMIPLVGTLTAATIISLLTLLIDGGPSAIGVAIFYLIYMQVEAYILSPRIMAQAVKVPGAVVVIAALAGGTLLGLLGALVAIPVAAAIILIVNKVIIPRQEAL